VLVAMASVCVVPGGLAVFGGRLHQYVLLVYVDSRTRTSHVDP
jgi:hypothetical protein